MNDTTVISLENGDVIRINVTGLFDGWKRRILFLSDVHIDSPYCDRRLLTKHMKEAQNEGAIVLQIGDTFDAMQGPKDPRASLRELKEILKGNDYSDRVLDDGINFFAPYADTLAMIGYGNHEYSVVRHAGTDMIQRFVQSMRREHKSPVVAGGYGGFIRIAGYIDSKSTPSANLRICYNHGSGGGAPVTKGTIQTARQAVWVRDVDCIWNGHNHQSYIMPQSTMGINNQDGVEQGLVYFLRTPGYKNEMQHPAHGYAVSGNMAPTPRGCIWGELTYVEKKFSIRYTQDIE